MTRYGGDGYGYCLLAGGHVDLVVESGLKAYDIVALIPIIEHAGGRVTTWEGADASKGGRIVAVRRSQAARRCPAYPQSLRLDSAHGRRLTPQRH